MRLLKEKGLLLRCYTQVRPLCCAPFPELRTPLNAVPMTFPLLQNIDTLERVAGLQPEDLVEAHGTFQTAHCLRSSCRHQYDLSWVKGNGGMGGDLGRGGMGEGLVCTSHPPAELWCPGLLQRKSSPPSSPSVTSARVW